MSQSQKLNGNVNDRTFQEVEYLKKSLGPILVAALAEICIRRPADPIEYLGHWLLRWRYNEELKRRDVQNAMDVVQQRQWAQMKEETQEILQEQVPEPVAPEVPTDPFSAGQLPGEEEPAAVMVPTADTLVKSPSVEERRNSRRHSSRQEAPPALPDRGSKKSITGAGSSEVRKSLTGSRTSNVSAGAGPRKSSGQKAAASAAEGGTASGTNSKRASAVSERKSNLVTEEPAAMEPMPLVEANE